MDQYFSMKMPFSLPHLLCRVYPVAFTLTVLTVRNETLLCENGFLDFETQIPACSMKQALYPLHKLNIALAGEQENTLIQVFCSVSGCQTCMCKRGINLSSFVL